MTKNKHFRSVFAALLCAVLCMTAFATVAYADGGDYYDDELPPETWQEEPQPEDTTIVPGTPFTEDGIAATRDLLYDKHTNKQFITVETRNGHTLYIVIDYDKLLDEEEERYQTYFLNPVDEADLMALLEDGQTEETPAACTCAEKCQAGAVNTACPVCSVNMSECAGKAPEVEPEPEPEPEKESGSGGALVLILLLAVLGGGAFAYIKFIKPKQGAKVSADPDDYEFEDEEYENEDVPEQGEQEDQN